MSHASIATTTIGWLNHDAWSEMFVACRRLVCEVLPSPELKQSAKDGGLCQLAIVGAHHMMEVALFSLLRQFVPINDASGKTLTESGFARLHYYEAISHWVPLVVGSSLPLISEPFLSTERLRQQRNDTTHKGSALATTAMARSALASSVLGTKALFLHFNKPFPYGTFLQKYPPPDAEYFSRVITPVAI